MISFHIFKQKKQNIYAVVDGMSFPIEDVNDQIFSKNLLGQGIAITAATESICSPCDGKLTTLFPTGHAFGIVREDGVEILVHIGIDTVNLKGKGFKILKKKNQFVKRGEKIVDVDFAYLKQMNLDSTVMVIVTNSQNKKLKQINYGKVESGKTEIISIQEKEDKQ